MASYDIRPFISGDREGFLSLYESVFGEKKSDAWFDWKYADNPYVDYIPIILGEHGGRIVGARSFFALPVAYNGERQTVLQPCDTMVHLDHRRQGLFTQMTAEAIDLYQNEYPFFFNFPNDQSLPGNYKLGWETVTQRESLLRVENPKRLLSGQTESTLLRAAGGLSTYFVQGYYKIRDQTWSQSNEIMIEKSKEIPVADLATLYRRSIPDRIHAVRDEQFHKWRWHNPDWEYTTYLAGEANDPISAIVVGRQRTSAVESVKLIDIAPLVNGSERAFSALVAQILTDYTGADIFTAPPQAFPKSVLRSFGFHASNSPPLSFLTDQLTHLVRPLADGWGKTDLDLTDPDSWLLTFAELDVN